MLDGIELSTDFKGTILTDVPRPTALSRRIAVRCHTALSRRTVLSCHMALSRHGVVRRMAQFVWCEWARA